MPLTTGYSFGDVVLVPFPFTDQSGSKKRPAVIVSSADYQAQRRDLVIMAITSQIRPRPAFTEFTVGAWKTAGLIAPSAVKPVLTTIEKRLVLKKLGQLQPADCEPAIYQELIHTPSVREKIAALDGGIKYLTPSQKMSRVMERRRRAAQRKDRRFGKSE